MVTHTAFGAAADPHRTIQTLLYLQGRNVLMVPSNSLQDVIVPVGVMCSTYHR